MEWYADMGATGSVEFKTSIDGTPILSDTEFATTGLLPNTAEFGPILLGGSDYGVESVLTFNFVSGGSMSAETLVNVNPTGVPEPTTLLLFGPGLIGLVAFGRRVRSKAL
jgi:hypothetical protein